MAALLLDFKAEYAKSGRASCKLCKSTIGQDSLRLALMVQSPHFDGKIPNWFHFSCFWKRARVAKTQDIYGYDTLRWEDQEKIKERISGGGGGGSTSGTSGNSAASEKNDFSTEYAKTGKSKCRSCENFIGKKEVRMGKKDYESERARMYGPQTNWYHMDCFVTDRDELEFTADIAPTTLVGYMGLEADDRKMLIERLGRGDPSKKRKAEVDTNNTPAKKSKAEIDEEEKLKTQSKLIWSWRDKLSGEVSNDALKGLLEYNGQGLPAGESRLLDAVSDCMTFGALKSCPECGEGQLKYGITGYHCTGNLTAYTKCMHVTKDPGRKAFKIPDEYKDVSFLKKYKYTARKRVFPTVDEDFAMVGPVSSSLDVVDSGKPLGGCKLAIVGKLSKPKAEIKKVIEGLGGTIVTKIDSDTTFCLSSQEEVDKVSKGIKDSKKADVQVVDEGFLEAVRRGGVEALISQHNLVAWGADPSARIIEQKPVKSAPNAAKSRQQIKSGMQDRMYKSTAGKLKLQVKGGAAVDPDSGLEHSYHILQDKVGEPYNAVLNAVNVVQGQNSYYKLQILEADKSSTCQVFRSWGRVGTSIGGTKLEKFSSKNGAIEEFKRLFGEKSGNEWDDRKNFVKQPNKFVMLDMDYGQDEPDIKVDLSKSSSKLDSSIQSVIRMIFDIESMKKAMLEFEIDLAKMPLGKLSKVQIQKSYGVLTELQQLFDNKGSTTMILDATNRFYSLIPHDFGMREMPLLDTQASIKTKIEMLDNLLDIEVAYNLLKSGDSGGDPIDAHYAKLQTDFKVLDKKSDMYARLVQYVENTHGVTHTMYTLEVLDIFEIDRNGEEERFTPFKEMHNRKLLWHGSRVTNYAGILSQGLRIAPPEAPPTGYMFGKGVYFADMVTKSANYCANNKNDPIGLMLLGEVALGNMHELTSSSYITKLPKGKHSTKGIGRTCPDPTGTYITPDGVEIPMGKGIKDDKLSSSLLYNEFIVYDTAQINLKYLFKMKFNYKW